VQLTQLVRENRQQTGPALAHLRNVVAVLRRNQDNLDRSIAMLAPFVRVFANTLGNGRWFDTYVENLIPVEAVPPPPGGTP
jgi:phospholipid/cholesterol/gamma-HCH transport system substrate-binding protein